MRTLQEVVEENTRDLRTIGVLFAVLAGLALIMGLIGVYGVMAYAMSLRVPEFGIRKALGARSGVIVRQTLLGSARTLLAGIIVGSLGGLMAGRLLRGFLYQVDTTDLGVLGGVVVLLTLTAVVAAYLPARRAASVDPAVSLRVD